MSLGFYDRNTEMADAFLKYLDKRSDKK